MNLHCQISYKAQIGSHIRLPHQGDGVIISAHAVIESHVTIYHQVTIGINEFLEPHNRKVVIKKNSYLCCGCKIINCTVGENSVIAPNASVYRDVPAHTKWYSMQHIKEKSAERNLKCRRER